MSHYMIDIETLSVRVDAAVMSIGMVEFDLTGIKRELYCELSLDAQPSRVIDQRTLQWWLSLGKKFPLGSASPEQAKSGIEEFFREGGPNPKVWAKGINFDIVILESLFSNPKPYPLWRYSDVRDARTVFKLCDYKFKEPKHHALHDAYDQALALIECLNKLGVELR